MAGYSGTPLAKKLGFKEGFRVAFINEPSEFLEEIGSLPEGIVFAAPTAHKVDLIMLFVKERSELAKKFSIAAKRLAPAGMLWIGWPKRASGVATDLSENIVREIGLAAGLVDIKVCAIDETWSGLKFVIRLRDRPGSKK